MLDMLTCRRLAGLIGDDGTKEIRLFVGATFSCSRKTESIYIHLAFSADK